MWNGFECDEFLFEGYEASVVKPTVKVDNPILILKTEYRNAFPIRKSPCFKGDAMLHLLKTITVGARTQTLTVRRVLSAL